MNVLVLNNMAPFVRGGAEELANHLVLNLRLAGANAQLCRVPFAWETPDKILDHMLAAKLLRVDGVDRVIPLKFPAYLLPFQDKVLWLLHQYRQAYDLWDAGDLSLRGTERGYEVRSAIVRADQVALSSARRIYTNSAVTSARLQKYNGLASEILMPPVNNPEDFWPESYGNYIFAGGRINRMKRQCLLIQAMRYAPESLKLVIAGPCDTQEDQQELQVQATSLGLQDRVVLDFGFHSRAKIASYVNNALACAYLPFDEDSVGYVTMEAFTAKKCMITTNDSGGLLQIVHNEETGLVRSATAQALGEALGVVTRAGFAQRLGQQAHALWSNLGITWPKTIEKLLS
jgi:glycosyltransferase involved in cell wall biosynthesis